MNSAVSLLYQFEHRIQTCKNELVLFEDENNIFKKVPGISNSSGNLVLHINGNLRHFIGQILGNSGYIRNRDFEFNASFLARELLQDQCDETSRELKEALQSFDDDDLDKIYPISLEFLPGQWTTHQFLIHLIAHQAYHLGQINAMRRILHP